MLEATNLHPIEVKALALFNPGEETSAKMLSARGLESEHVFQALSWLCQKGLIYETHKTEENYFELTEVGRAWLQSGHPVKRVFSLLEKGEQTMADIIKTTALEQRDVGSAVGLLKKQGAAVSNGATIALSSSASVPKEVTTQENLIKSAQSEPIKEESLSADEKSAILAIAKKRGDDAPFRINTITTSFYTITPDGEGMQAAIKKEGITGNEIGLLTSAQIESGEWKNRGIRQYELVVPTSKIYPGRTNPYSDFIRWVKDKLVSFGFEEFDGPLTENEFWNGDALFMPQFHSARDIHDVYYVKDPETSDPVDKKLLSAVAGAHESGEGVQSRGWEYKFDKNFTHRMLLRSQGTVLSAHQLAKAKIPGKYFGVVRCFRVDDVDATHGADFYQTEGILIGKNATLKNLLGLLKMFATEIAGASEVKYVPGYFPFTEPSIEVHIKHPVLGWFELGGSGIFRPEVTRPFGIDVPVLAWGMGIDRMALMKLGLSDIRELFSPNLESVRMRRAK